MSYYVKLLTTLNKYLASPCSEAEVHSDKNQYAAIIDNSSIPGNNNWGQSTVTLFMKGVQKDIELNGWTFAGVFYEKHKYNEFNKNDCRIHVIIDYIAPSGIPGRYDLWKLNPKIFYQEGPELYFSTIAEICLCENEEEFQRLQFFNEVEEYCYNEYNLPQLLTAIKILSKIIKKNEGNIKVPSFFIENAKRKYKEYFNKLLEHTPKDLLIQKLIELE